MFNESYTRYQPQIRQPNKNITLYLGDRLCETPPTVQWELYPFSRFYRQVKLCLDVDILTMICRMRNTSYASLHHPCIDKLVAWLFHEEKHTYKRSDAKRLSRSTLLTCFIKLSIWRKKIFKLWSQMRLRLMRCFLANSIASPNFILKKAIINEMKMWNVTTLWFIVYFE